MQPGSDETEWREDRAPRRVLLLFATNWTGMVPHTLRASWQPREPVTMLYDRDRANADALDAPGSRPGARRDG